MKSLLFDVSTSVMYVAYAKQGMLVDFSIRLAKRDHAKYLVDRIDQLLQRNRVKLDDINEIIIGIGPGSYTGLRIAVMVGKMLAYTKKIPLKTVSSLFFMTSGYEGKVAAMIDARRGQVFSAVYENGNILIQDELRLLSDLTEEKIYQNAQTIFIDESHYEVSPKKIMEKAVLVEDVHQLIPNYLRKTEAEHNYDQKSKTQ
ncbi:MAG: tRNA (adenosine(37)-N6)-threonylcarbamoyltransferase complex dimerization subunit type 1 TsaB [Acholeplasmataceae bacterium]|nr:tRNA (adenosine(37)-N6)-threonylcarbamoyltransferase complex dimerization subunit type 1 TsaB [Acholeplasmataceae bacterium]